MNQLPSASDNGTFLINMFNDKRISPHDLAALVGAHSTSRQFNTSTNRSEDGFSQDSTPGTWDVDFYNETMFPPVPGVYQFESDLNILNTPETRAEWVLFVGDQLHWNEDFGEAFIRLTLAGVNNINDGLYECTNALPASKFNFRTNAQCFSGWLEPILDSTQARTTQVSATHHCPAFLLKMHTDTENRRRPR